MDPDCGIRTWWKRPTFWIKILWCVFSLAIFIYLCCLDYATTDPFITKAWKKGPGAVSILIHLFVIASIAGNILYYFKVIPKINTIILYSACATTALSMILAIIYASVFGSNKAEIEFKNTVVLWLFAYPNDPARIWLCNHLSKSGNPSDDIIQNYVDFRCTGAGETLLGLLITWFVFQCFLLFIFLQEDEYEEFGNTQPIIKDREDDRYD